MKNSKILILTILVIAIHLLSCSNSTKSGNINSDTNSYLTMYKGGYMIALEGQPIQSPVEMYVLKENGSAEWKLVEVKSGGAYNIMSEKTGTWGASKSSIRVKINGNTGLIEENYLFQNGKFRSGDRYLQKTN